MVVSVMDIDLELSRFSVDKVWWSDLLVREFLDRAQLPEVAAQRLASRAHLPAKNLTLSVVAILEDICVANGLQVDITCAMQTLSTDHLIYAFLELHRILPLIEGLENAERANVLNNALEELLSPQHIEVPEPILDPGVAEAAFFAPQRKAPNSDYPSVAILHGVLERYDQYRNNPDMFVAPYTSIVGPSGIGKSFCVQQLAAYHGVSVIYINLRTNDDQEMTSAAFPLRSTVKVPQPHPSHQQLESAWSGFLSFFVRLARTARDHGITPAGLFYLLSREAHTNFGSEATELLKNDPLDVHGMVQLVTKYKKCLDDNNNNPPPIAQATHSSYLPIVICFDEARDLLKPDGLPFEALRSAARQLFKQTLASEEKENFFIMLLDTTSRITDFTPPKRLDQLQLAQSRQVLQPLWKVDTWAVFSDAPLPEPDGTITTVSALFKFGRPLWAAYLDAGVPIDKVVLIAERKLSTLPSESRRNRDIALLCMKVNFYIGQYTVAEHLVSTYLRFVVDISTERDTLLSTQPREPLLAFVSSRLLSNSITRLEVLRSWESSLAAGTVNPGDAGEHIAALILLFAFDDASRPTVQLPGPIPLDAYWRALFGDKKKWYQGDGHDTKDAFVFCNHIVRVSSHPSQRVIEEAYRRGAALLVPAQFPGIDLLIPMKRDAGIGAILIQVKNRIDDALTNSLKQNFKADMKTAIMELDLDHHLPGGYLGLGLCLRRKSGPDYEVLSTKPITRHGTITFPLVCALGLDVFEWKSAWPNGKQIADLFERILKSWPQMYPQSVLDEQYARKLIYPFLDVPRD